MSKGKKNPWMKFYPTDWRSDPRLRMCSLAARGLWIELCGLMHESEPYGHLLVSGRAPTDAQVGVLAGAPSEQISDLIGELESAGVFSRTKDGVIYSRRMTRDMKKSAIARKNGQNGGNPSLGKQKGFKASDNQNPTDPHNTQKPEARSQRKKEDPDGSSKKSRGSRLKPDWQPSSKTIVEAVRIGLSEQQARHQAERFRDYWIAQPGQRGVKLDWMATWRNWCRSHIDRHGSTQTGGERVLNDAGTHYLKNIHGRDTWIPIKEGSAH